MSPLPCTCSISALWYLVNWCALMTIWSTEFQFVRILRLPRDASWTPCIFLTKSCSWWDTSLFLSFWSYGLQPTKIRICLRRRCSLKKKRASGKFSSVPFAICHVVQLWISRASRVSQIFHANWVTFYPPGTLLQLRTTPEIWCSPFWKFVHRIEKDLPPRHYWNTPLRPCGDSLMLDSHHIPSFLYFIARPVKLRFSKQFDQLYGWSDH